MYVGRVDVAIVLSVVNQTHCFTRKPFESGCTLHSFILERRHKGVNSLPQRALLDSLLIWVQLTQRRVEDRRMSIARVPPLVASMAFTAANKSR